jgi:hypothetical protein
LELAFVVKRSVEWSYLQTSICQLQTGVFLWRIPGAIALDRGTDRATKVVPIKAAERSMTAALMKYIFVVELR